MLEIKGINVFYGAIQALDDVSIQVRPGEIVAIIGSNGAGKSTLLRTISGLIRARTGSISYNGVDITDSQPHEIVKMGLSQAPEGRRIFTNMSVQENLQLGAYLRKDNKVQSDMDALLDRFPRLRERFKQSAGTLSGGEQQMLAISRALMSNPEILLLDEPSLGLAPFLITEIFNIVKDLNRDGKTVLIVEQNANRALEISDRAYVLETGVVVLEGTGKDLLVDPKVKEAYLGG
jgi:branched-chain amino acid transport system ATP-binding protein